MSLFTSGQARLTTTGGRTGAIKQNFQATVLAMQSMQCLGLRSSGSLASGCQLHVATAHFLTTAVLLRGSASVKDKVLKGKQL